MIQISEHAEKRMAQRNLSPEDVAYVLIHGIRYRREGALFYFLRGCDIPEWDQTEDEYTRLEGTAVVLASDGNSILTAWRNQKKGLRIIERKPKRQRRRRRSKRWN